MKGRGFLLSVVVLLLLLGSVAQAATYMEEVELFFDSVSDIILEIDGDNGSVTYAPWSGANIRVVAIKRVTALTEGIARQIAEDIRIDSSQNPERIRVESILKPFQLLVQQSVSFLVHVPSDWLGSVYIRTQNGSIDASHILGDADLKTSNGSISVRDQTGRLVVETSNGSIDLAEINSNLRARSSNGRVTVTGAVLRGVGEIGTSNGHVRVESVLTEDAFYDVTTSNGGLDVTLHAPVDVRIDLRTSTGSINLRNATVEATELSKQRVIGRIGSGRAALNAKTSNGSVTLTVQ